LCEHGKKNSLRLSRTEAYRYARSFYENNTEMTTFVVLLYRYKSHIDLTRESEMKNHARLMLSFAVIAGFASLSFTPAIAQTIAPAKPTMAPRAADTPAGADKTSAKPTMAPRAADTPAGAGKTSAKPTMAPRAADTPAGAK
jgi:hypothetical protein